jgi:hypothetical protein
MLAGKTHCRVDSILISKRVFVATIPHFPSFTAKTLNAQIIKNPAVDECAFEVPGKIKS